MNFDIVPISDILKKLKKKDKSLFAKLEKKINQIINLNYYELQHFKNLKYPSNEFKRVHVGSFVLTFKVTQDKIIFVDFDHHDKIYK
ncbi:MAG: addiction module toxin RelE [Candidatus ainarchaeum sp.]|nr:addiction module toxin RelE [Candidatus ainarchaeum sp.]